jgi:hypothetical protein
MTTCKRIIAVFFLTILVLAPARAQQLLGSIAGTVTDATGAVVPKVEVTIHNQGTNLEQKAATQNNGYFSFFDLPIGAYTVSFSKQGFKTAEYTQEFVQANRTTTVSPKLQLGAVNATVEVSESNTMNQVDTTNGYILSDAIIQNTPLGTGSFTQLATLSPGVNADLLGGSGTNQGLGNQSIWANGQRDTSNSFEINGISNNNLFNGKSSSSVGANRVVLNTGERFNSDGTIQTSTSVYDAIGEALPSPAPETLEELRVNTSMYDASQGANSGAHIELLTRSGTNAFHGQVYEYFQNNIFNAAPFFRNADPTIPKNQKVPALHRNTFGATLGGPIIHDKLFFFGSYQGVRASDALGGIASDSVPLDLTNDRSAAALANVANLDFGTSITPSQIDPVALALLNAKSSNGQFLVPSATITDPNVAGALGFDSLLVGPSSTFTVNQFNGNIDYNFSNSDRLAGKYYYQNDPTTNPFGGGGDNATSTLGFTQHLKAGSQVFSLNNTTNLSNSLVWEQRLGFTRQIAFAFTDQPLTPSSVGISLFGSNHFPGILIDDADNNFHSFNIGTTSNFANAGLFQNQYELGTNLHWVVGRHSFAFGGNWDHNQLNVINLNTQIASIDFRSFPDFLTGNIRGGVGHSQLFSGTSNRHYRANQTGAYAQDNIKLTKNLNVSLGIRYDYDGPLSEINGLLTNFRPDLYKYDLATDTIINDGLVIAGNNKQFGTKGVSDSTLTGRQWGIAPRIGIVWSPGLLKDVVVRAGYGIYYDRGEFFTEFSPSAGFGFNGPFGVTLEPPFIVPVTTGPGATFSVPFGTTPPAPPPNSLAGFAALLPNQAGLEGGANPFLFGGYDPRNKLPYSENWTFDIQWQPSNTLMLDLAYVGNHGVHETVPVPFNQPNIATPTHPVNGQIYSYGYNPTDTDGGILLTEPFNTSTGGNTDLRVPFIGYNPNSVFYEAQGISNYHALQANFSKRMGHGLQFGASYTWSHTLDEQSGLGLFYNGNDPLNLRSGYASSDFDRTHVFNVHYFYELPKFADADSVAGKLVNGWGFSGITTAQSGQPYNVYDFSGSVASIFYSANDFITNPIVGLAPGFTPTSAQTHGQPGAIPPVPSLNPNAFLPPQLLPGQDGVPPCGGTNTNASANFCDTVENTFSSGGRNIFRGPFQTRFDFSIIKQTKLSERFNLKYTADFFNIFNHTSFDTPNNNVTFNPCFNPVPCYTFSNVPPTPPQGNLGVIQHTIGSPRFVQMSLHLIF